MGLGAVLNAYGISRPPPGFDPRTVQPVASESCTKYAMRAQAKTLASFTAVAHQTSVLHH